MNLDRRLVGEVGPLLGLLYEGDEVLDSSWLTRCQITVSWCGYIAISRGPMVSCMCLEKNGFSSMHSTKDQFEQHSVLIRSACDSDQDTVCALQWLDCDFSDGGSHGECNIMVFTSSFRFYHVCLHT